MTAAAFDGILIAPLSRGASAEARDVERESAEAVFDANMQVPWKAAVFNELCSLAFNEGLVESDAGNRTLHQAVRFLVSLPATLAPPDASVDPDGEFGLDWYTSSRLMSVSIGSGGTVSYAAHLGDAPVSGTFRVDKVIPPAVKGYLSHFMK